MIKIRNGVFETNSSTTHTLTIVSNDEYEKWRNGELLYDFWKEKLVDPEKDEIDEDCVSYDKYFEDDYLEIFNIDYKTESGDEIVVFGKYGHD